MKLSLIKKEVISTIKLAWPVSLGQLGHIMLGVVDSMMVGRVSVDALAAASLVNGLFFLIIVLGIGVTMATTPLVSIAIGQKKYHKCSNILNQSIVLNSFIAISLTIIIFLISYLIKYLNQPESVVKYAISYMQILSYSILPFLIFQVFRQFIEGVKLTKLPMYVAIAANVINLIGNWILIYGNLGAPAMGLDGAGYSTLITRIFMALSIIFIVKKSSSLKKFQIKFNFKKIDRILINKLISIGFPSGLMYTLEVGVFAFAAVMIGWLGSSQLAAHQIAISLASISYMIILGISTAGTIKVGIAFGKNDHKELRLAGFSAIFVGIMFMSLSGVAFVIFNHFLPSLYISDQKVISIASVLLLIAAIFQISDGIQAISIGILRGIMDVKIPMYFTLIAYWLIAAPISYILGFKFKFGVYGVWVGLLLGLTTAAVLLLLRFHKKSKIVIQKRVV